MVEQDFVFDIEAMRKTHPEMNHSAAVFLDALCHHNPTLPRKVCALIGGRIMAQLAEPASPLKAHAFMRAIEWLQGQAEGMELVDPDQMLSKGLEEARGGGSQ